MHSDTRSELARLSLTVLALLPLAAPSSDSHQPSTVVVTVIDAVARYPLPNADVIYVTTGQHHFTDENGQARLPWPSDGQLRVRVREVGYKPLERVLDRPASGEAMTFALSKIAYVIAPVKATGHCVTTDDSASLALSASVLDQLRQGAEKYNEFRRLYPFDVSIERRTARIPEVGPIERITLSKERFPSETWDVPYKPGDIVEYTRDDGFSVPILSLSTLGDSVFWGHHCFIARGIEPYREGRAVRLEFFPTRDLRGPDWAGAALLDSATSNILRIEFRMVNANRRKAPARLEGYQTFTSPSPFIIIPDTVAAIWWMGDRSKDDPDAERADFAQSLTVDSLRYRKVKPPVNPSAKQ